MVMDYIDGINLNAFHYEHLYQSLLVPVPLAAFIISRIARALSYSHNYLIHRDISPENILINTQGICKLSDFGIAVASHKKPEYWAGKLSYMAPEQIFNQPIDERIDLFSLGSVAYQILTGIPLIEVHGNLPLPEQIALIKKQLASGIVPIHEVRKDIPQELSDIIQKMLSPNPHKRYQRASSIANDLEKKFLYAKGYGPTNNSLSTYMAIFENKFTLYNEEQIEQLSFLKNQENEVQIKRPLSSEGYTSKGLELLDARRGSEIYKRLRATSHIRSMEESRSEERSPFLKVKYLDNVIESFCITETPISIGQSPTSTIVLDDPGVISNHCRINYLHSQIMLQTNMNAVATINGKAVVQKELREGDKIKLGSHILFFIRQTALPALESQDIYDLDESLNINVLSTLTNFGLNLQVNPKQLNLLAKLTDLILSTTNLSELKLGVIPTSLTEALQLLKTNDEDNFYIRIIRTPVRLIFRCSGFHKNGYLSLLSNFRKHRQRLSEELAEKENAEEFVSEEAQTNIFSIEEALMDSKAELQTPDDDVVFGEEDSDIDIDIDMDDFDPSMLAAMLIVHGFDRIEFKKQSCEVELVVYL